METSIQSISLSELGGLEMAGTTVLQNESLIAGFTGGSFINIFDKNKTPLFLASTKSGLPLGSSIDRDIAKEVGWGVNPGKAELYISEYVKKKIAWWTIKLPIIKSRIVPTTREVTWKLEIPPYIMNREEINIEVINSHTPSYRVIEALETAGNITYSFVLRCGLSTAFLYIEISRGAFDYSDFERYCCTVLDWAADEDCLMTLKALMFKI